MKCFLGLVNFCAKYIRDFATLAEPLRKLTRKEVKWQWNSEQQMTFETLKQRLTSAGVMSYYNQNAETNIIVDGSPVGLGAILNQKQSDGNVKPVAYASRTLSPVERRYSQTEREAISVYCAIKRFNMYLYGMCFAVYTDHKPLERMFTSVHEAPARIQKLVLDLQQYEFVVKYLPGHLNAADILSRSPGAESYENDYESTEQFVCYVAQNAVPKALTIAEIQKASEKEKTICKIRKCMEKNKWTKEGELKPYFIVRKDLSVHQSIILKGRKLVIPRKLRQRIRQLPHESHQGVLKTKQLLREKFGGREWIKI